MEITLSDSKKYNTNLYAIISYFVMAETLEKNKIIIYSFKNNIIIISGD